MSFMNIGRMIGKEIRKNICFNPFARSLNPEFGAIDNPKSSTIVKSIEPREIRKYLSVVFIYLFRFLRFMKFIDVEGQRPGSLNVSRSISYQFSRENRRVYLQELMDIQHNKTSPSFRGKIENCHGI